MNLLLLAIFAAQSWAQVSLVPSGPATVRQGSVFTVTITLAGATATGPAAVQWNTILPTGFTAGTPTTPLSGRTLACALPLCILYGITQSPLANGVIATIPMTVPGNAALGDRVISLASAIGVTTTGGNLAVTSSGTYTVKVLTSLRDIDGDGTITLTDVQAMTTQALGGTCANDQNGDGVCNVQDVFLVVLGVLGIFP